MPNPDFPQLLGRYIYLANPYPAAPPPAAWAQPSPAAMTYPGVNPASGAVVNAGLLDEANGWYGPCFEDAEMEQYRGHWDFKGVKRYIARAVRVPYMYYRATENPGGAILLVDHFLIGFEGSGGQ